MAMVKPARSVKDGWGCEEQAEVKKALSRFESRSKGGDHCSVCGLKKRGIIQSWHQMF